MFVEYINSILSVSEPALEPVVDKIDDATRIQLREDQDLRCGAVRTALVSEGAGRKPESGDAIHFHYTVRQEGSKAVAASTLKQHGGSGCPHVSVLEKGKRIPRGWELVLKDMKEGQVSLVFAKPEYSFQAPCNMDRPKQLPEGATTETEIRLLHVVPASNVKPLAICNSIIKTILRAGEGWQTPRAPFNVTFREYMRPLTHFSSDTGEGSGMDSWSEHNSTMGCHVLPEGLELALNSMPVGERASFIVPSTLLQLEGCQDMWKAVPGAEGHEAVQVFLELVAMEEIRDMTGDGKVLKRKCKEGAGHFPVDAPVHDAVVTIRYSLHEPTASKQAGSCIWTGSDMDNAKHLDATFSTGEGCMAAAIEMAVRLMLPGEESEVYFDAQYGFKEASEAPDGVPLDKAMVVRLALLSFEKEGHPQAMDAEQMIKFCERKKERGNALYSAGKFTYSLKRFDEALQALKSFRGDQSDEQTVAIRKLQIALFSNSAAALMGMKEWPEAIRRCDAGIEMDNSNDKLVLRRAKACSMNGDYEEALEICNALKPIAPESMQTEIEALIELNGQRERVAKKKQKAQFGKF